MSKSAKKLSPAPARVSAATATPKTAGEPKIKKAAPGSKQSRVIALLSSSNGTTIAAMMKATGWQQHSVRGFLAGVVRTKLKLKLSSKKIDGNRVYCIDSRDSAKAGSKTSKRRTA